MTEPPRRQKAASPVDSLAPSGAHPFLTDRGLWLQQNARIDLPESIPMPRSGPGSSFEFPAANSLDLSGDIEHRPSDSSVTPLLGRFRDAPIDSGTMQNIRTSKRFPDPSRLRIEPLTRYYQTFLAASRTDDAIRTKQLQAIGKLVIHLAGGRPDEFASGSAWISGPNTIVTCAHNLFDSNTRRWSMGLEFYPGYDFYSQKPLPVCRVISATISKGYLENPLTNHDWAICKVDCNIGDMVGAEISLQAIPGIDFFDSTPVLISGYPAGSGFDFGKQLWQSRGEFLFGMSGGGEDDFAPAVATSFGGGTSGCPWLAKDPETGLWVAVGVTSGHAKLRYDPGEPNLMSLTSPLMNQNRLDRINEDSVQHEFIG